MSEVLKEELEEELVGFSGDPIMNDLDAEEALQEIRDAQDQLEKMEAWYARMLELNRQKTEAIVSNLTAKLRNYFEMVPHHQTKTQESYALPSGKLVLKAQQPEFQRDDKLVIDWLKKTSGRFVKVKESVDWAEMKSSLQFKNGAAIDKETGEVVPGIKVIDRDPVFVIGK